MEKESLKPFVRKAFQISGSLALIALGVFFLRGQEEKKSEQEVVIVSPTINSKKMREGSNELPIKENSNVYSDGASRRSFNNIDRYPASGSSNFFGSTSSYSKDASLSRFDKPSAKKKSKGSNDLLDTKKIIASKITSNEGHSKFASDSKTPRRFIGGGANAWKRKNNQGETIGEPERELGNFNSGKKKTFADKNGPKILKVSSLSGDGEFGLSRIIEIEVEFDEEVYTSSMQLDLSGGGKAVYKSGSGSKKISFEYEVKPGDYAEDLDVIAVIASDAKDRRGNKAQDEVPTTNNLAEVNDVKVDSESPTVVEVATSKGDGAYSAGEVIDLQVIMSEPVVITGAPILNLNSGGLATFLSPLIRRR